MSSSAKSILDYKTKLLTHPKYGKYLPYVAVLIPALIIGFILLWVFTKSKPYTYDELLPKMADADRFTAGVLEDKKSYDGLRDQLGAPIYDGLLAIPSIDTPLAVTNHVIEKYEPSRQMYLDSISKVLDEDTLVESQQGIVTLADLEATRTGTPAHDHEHEHDHSHTHDHHHGALRPVDPDAKSYALQEAEKKYPYLRTETVSRDPYDFADFSHAHGEEGEHDHEHDHEHHGHDHEH